MERDGGIPERDSASTSSTIRRQCHTIPNASRPGRPPHPARLRPPAKLPARQHSPIPRVHNDDDVSRRGRLGKRRNEERASRHRKVPLSTEGRVSPMIARGKSSSPNVSPLPTAVAPNIQLKPSAIATRLAFVGVANFASIPSAACDRSIGRESEGDILGSRMMSCVSGSLTLISRRGRSADVARTTDSEMRGVRPRTERLQSHSCNPTARHYRHVSPCSYCS